MKNSKIITFCLLAIFILPLMFSSYVTTLPVQAVTREELTFNPIVEADVATDKNRNKIHDHLEKLISSSFSSDYFDTIVTFDEPVTDSIIEKIESIGGEILAKWSVIYGAGVRIKSKNIELLAQLAEVTYVTENFRSSLKLSTSVPQINVRPYVWDTLGYEGDSDIVIAVLDTGIDDTHLDFTGRIDYWKDFIGSSYSGGGDEYLTATDKNGHGTHCASIAAGSGAASGTGNFVEVTSTLGIEGTLDYGRGYFGHFEVESTGDVTISVQWDEKPGPSSSTDTIIIVADTDRDNKFELGSDDYITGDYSDQPIDLALTDLAPGKYAYLIGGGEASEIDRSAVRYTITRPAAQFTDSHNNYRGVAPGSHIVSLKVLDDTGIGDSVILNNALNWIYTNGATYGIDIVSMSLGLDSVSSATDNAVNNLVSLGYLCVVAAGNEFLDGTHINSPGTASKAITVGAIDDVDKIAIYSSNGASGSGKPDVVAPGGAYRYMQPTDEDTQPIVAADSNDADLVIFTGGSPTEYWESDINPDDYAEYQGTSMATPHVAGLAALIMDALGTDWTHTEADVLKIKNLLCGTATEVSFGEAYDTYTQSPTINRGDADLVEGFGKVHADAAIEAFLTTYVAGSVETDSLSSDPTGKQSWARKVELQENIIFTAGIEMDGSADYDLYLYDPSEDMSQYLGYVTSSTTVGTGLPENIEYTPTSDMTAYIVIKRVSGEGSFTLSAEATATGNQGFSLPFGLPMIAWVIFGTLGLASIVLVFKRNK